MSTNKQELLVIGLHRVGIAPAEATHRGLFTSPELLLFTIRSLSKMGFRFSTLRDAANRPGRTAVLTFDDGYLDNFTEAKPILDHFRIPATVFVVTGDVGKNSVVWEEAGEKLPADLMNWDHLRTLSNGGWEIGSHAHEHIHLDRYCYSRQKETIIKSIVEIERETGVRPVSFCYPYGVFDRSTRAAVQSSGLRYALTSRNPVTTCVDQLDDLELGRVVVGGRKIDRYLKCSLRALRAMWPSRMPAFAPAKQAGMSSIRFKAPSIYD